MSMHETNDRGVGRRSRDSGGERTSRVAMSSSRRGVLAAVIGVAAWVIGPALSKGIDLEALATAFHRSWLGAVFSLVVLHLNGGRLSLRALRLSAVGGAVLGIEMALFFSAIKRTTVANTTVIEALQPLLIMVVVGPLFGERVRPMQVFWTFGAVSGVVLVAAGSVSSGKWSLSGDVLAVAAVVAWAGYFIASKAARQSLGALEYQAALLLVASVVLTPIVLLSGHDLAVDDRRTATGLLVLATVPTIAHLLINWAHAHVRLALLSLLTLALPVISTVLAALFLDEPIVVLQVFGIAVAVASIGTALWLDTPTPRTPARVET